jgi:hypothetical protein
MSDPILQQDPSDTCISYTVCGRSWGQTTELQRDVMQGSQSDVHYGKLLSKSYQEVSPSA